jgi:hypothetical protein
MSALSQRTIAPRDHSRTRQGLYIPLHLRLACFYTLLLIGIFAFFGIYVYQQARQQAYQELDNALSTRAASIQLGKDLSPSYMSSEGTKYPLLLPGDNGIGIGGISIEILSTKQASATSLRHPLPGMRRPHRPRFADTDATRAPSPARASLALSPTKGGPFAYTHWLMVIPTPRPMSSRPHVAPMI